MATFRYKMDVFRDTLSEHKALNACLLLLLVLCIGAFFEGFYELVPRLGAVLVALGVIWEMTVVGQLQLAREKSIIEVTLNSASGFAKQLAAHKSDPDHYSHPNIDGYIQSTTRHAEGYQKELSFVILTGSAVIIFGTVLWAFGDWTTCALIESAKDACSDSVAH